MKVSFDGPNRLMVVNHGVLEIDVEVDLYSEWKAWKLLGDNGKYLPAMRTVGGDPTTAGRALGATFFLSNGWRVRSWEGDHRLSVTGNLFTEEGESPFVPVLGPYTAVIESSVSNLVDRLTRLEQLPTQDWTQEQFDAVIAAQGEFPTAVQIAQEVWETPQAQRMELAAKILQNKTITNPTTGQMVVFDDDGVTPLLVANIFEDVDETQPYRGQGAEVRERLE